MNPRLHGPGYHYYLKVGEPPWQKYFKPADAKSQAPSWTDVPALALVVCGGNQALTPAGRFCANIFGIARKNPSQLEAIPRGAGPQTSTSMEYRSVVTYGNRKVSSRACLPSMPPDYRRRQRAGNQV